MDFPGFKITFNLLKAIRSRWNRQGGYRELLVLGLPLIVSTGSWSVQHFVDRMFLTWYSSEAIAASMPAGMLNFTIMSLFIGTAGYVNTFVAQYYGADQKNMAGPSMWQGIYMSILAGVLMIGIAPLSDEIFSLTGHEQKVMENEIIYFRILCYGAFPMTAASAMSGFFSGVGKTGIIMWVNIWATAVNLTLDYLLIFGNWGFPEMGITGAAIASVISFFSSFILYVVIFLRKSYRREYASVSGWRFDFSLFSRLIRYGFPNGIQFFIEISGFTFFIFFIGSLGRVSLAATNIAFNINTLAFMPMIGFGIAVSIMVGQYLGKDNPELAEYSAYSGFHFTLAYMVFISLLYLFTPDIFLIPFAAQADPGEFEAIRRLARILLRFVALYCVFDTLNIIFASAIKGAGDTRFVMFILMIVSLFVLIVPSYILIYVFGFGIYAGWGLATAYVIILGLVFFLRFYSGRWKEMRVIDQPVITLPPAMCENPTSDGGV